MTISLWAFREVQQLEDHQAGSLSSDPSFKDRESFLRQRAHRAVFGESWRSIPDGFLERFEEPTTAQEAQGRAQAAGFNLCTDRGVVLRDWLVYAVVIEASKQGVWGARAEEIEAGANERVAQRLEREARHWSNTRGNRHRKG